MNNGSLYKIERNMMVYKGINLLYVILFFALVITPTLSFLWLTKIISNEQMIIISTICVVIGILIIVRSFKYQRKRRGFLS